ncbi:MAG: hypothetical protein CVU29_03355 [Betaproteobacteria bacterium HGW-Betaproteobacteria-22]|nr:MAG: hypothetical protein CVU29_03355 [Betaproteobacteria bacterium HGW-Betaproteobacteria-22]
MTSLPIPNTQAQAHSLQLAQLIKNKIVDCGGWLSFADFMQMALYTPGLGYYSGGAKKFGAGGDFVTAPEISPVFAQTLVHQLAQVLAETDGNVLELGAGTGRLAVDLLMALEGIKQWPERYFILEVSAHLREIQKKTVKDNLPAHLAQCVVWLDALPEDFVGVIIGNEVLDAIPAHLIYHGQNALFERGVKFEGGFVWQDKLIEPGALLDYVKTYDLPEDYLTEVNPAANGLINSLAQSLLRGVVLLVDYGFCAREYYHPQRNLGTLMCHFQQYAHTDPLIYVGLQDLTTHVDFSAIAHAALNAGLTLEGYCTQAQFLMNCGILDQLSRVPADDVPRYAPLAAAVQKLLSPAEMGDLFKVIALSKGIERALIGFMSGDRSHTL